MRDAALKAARKKARAKLRARGMRMTLIRRREDCSRPPAPGGGYPIIETRTDFYGVKLSPALSETGQGVGAGEELVVIMPGDTRGGRPDTSDRLAFQGRLWGIVRILPVAPAELDIICKVAVKEEGGEEGKEESDD